MKEKSLLFHPVNLISFTQRNTVYNHISLYWSVTQQDKLATYVAGYSVKGITYSQQTFVYCMKATSGTETEECVKENITNTIHNNQSTRLRTRDSIRC